MEAMAAVAISPWLRSSPLTSRRVAAVPVAPADSWGAGEGRVGTGGGRVMVGRGRVMVG